MTVPIIPIDDIGMIGQNDISKGDIRKMGKKDRMRLEEMGASDVRTLLTAKGVSENGLAALGGENLLEGMLFCKLTDGDLKDAGVETIQDRKRIRSVIDEAKFRDGVRKPTGWESFLWGLAGFFLIFPFDILAFVHLKTARPREAHALGWGIVWNIILSALLIPVVIAVATAISEMLYYML